jgi:hypothetical protein
VSLVPIIVTLSGAGPYNGAYKALVGQGITAQIQASDPLTLLSSYQWDIGGGSPFKHFLVADDATWAHPTFLEGLDFTGQSCHFYCALDGQVTATCHATATVGGAQFNVIGRAHFESVRPSATFIPELGSTGLQIDVAHNLLLCGTGGAGPAHDKGVIWHTSVTTPAPFSPPVNGGWHVLQIITPAYSYTKPGELHKIFGYGETGLDGHYPYDPAPYVVQAGDIPGQYEANGVEKQPSDSPGGAFPITATSISMNLTADMYLMFLPPGLDVEWVPLKKHSWFFSTTVVIPASGNWADWSINQPNNTQVNPTTTFLGDWSQHPVWLHTVPY